MKRKLPRKISKTNNYLPTPKRNKGLDSPCVSCMSVHKGKKMLFRGTQFKKKRKEGRKKKEEKEKEQNLLNKQKKKKKIKIKN